MPNASVRLTDKARFRKLRLSMRFEFCLNTEVYLNGHKIVRCERGVCAEPAVVLGANQMKHLRAGKNVLAVKPLRHFRWNGTALKPFNVRGGGFDGRSPDGGEG